jgi:hypothetical protein
MRSFIDLIESINYKNDTIFYVKQVAILITKLEHGNFSLSHIELRKIKNNTEALNDVLVDLKDAYLPKIEAKISELEDEYFLNDNTSDVDKEYIHELKEVVNNFQLLFSQQEWKEKGHWHHLMVGLESLQQYNKPLPVAFKTFFKYATLPLVYYFENN